MATVDAFHAHPDDEVLLTGGTLARLAAEGHRTVVVVACCGGLGRGAVADPETRLAELRASTARLGVARTVHLGYADSGHGPVLFPDPPGQGGGPGADPVHHDVVAVAVLALRVVAEQQVGAFLAEQGGQLARGLVRVRADEPDLAGRIGKEHRAVPAVRVA